MANDNEQISIGDLVTWNAGTTRGEVVGAKNSKLLCVRITENHDGKGVGDTMWIVRWLVTKV